MAKIFAPHFSSRRRVTNTFTFPEGSCLWDGINHFVENVMGEEFTDPLQKVYGGIILGSKKFIRDALERVKAERLKSPETSHGKTMDCNLEI